MAESIPHSAINAKESMNQMGSQGIAFLFIIDFLMEKPLVIPLKDVNTDEILFSFKGKTNHKTILSASQNIKLERQPISFKSYQKSFDTVMKHLKFGNSYLVNLTAETPLRCHNSLLDIYKASQASYKLYYKDHFTFFSPEPFITIQDNIIRSFPMKGTADASNPDAHHKILANEKELAEHHTIVDLIRNDLNKVSKKVRVERFRYIDTLQTSHGKLLQVSSEIAGDLSTDWNKGIGDILFSMLPAGSISGAPKKRTIEIIREAETHQRGYYTGISGVFDGKDLISAVMIRYIEQRNGKLFFKSGGGITINSDVNSEYNEMIQKVYVTTD